MSRHITGAIVPFSRQVYSSAEDFSSAASYYPRLMIRILAADQKEISDFVFLIRYHKQFIHLLNPRKSFSFETGRSYQFQFLFPSGHTEITHGKISYQMAGNGGFGILLQRYSERFRLELGRSLFQSDASYTPKKLRAIGLQFGSLKSLVRYCIVNHAEDYQQVKALRYIAYLKAGKLPDQCQMSHMGDEFDQRSLLLVAKHQSKIVASMRLILNSDSDLGEHEQFVSFPAAMPKKSETIEITRVCTDPDYRGSDLLQGLFQYASQVAIGLDRAWILGSSTPSLLPIYRKIGFRSTGLSYVHQDLNKQSHIIFLANKYDILFGRTVGPIHWNIMYADVYRYARDHQLLAQRKPFDRLRIAFYLVFGQLISWLKSSYQKLKL